MRRFNLVIGMFLMAVVIGFANGINAQEDELLTLLPKTRAFEIDPLVVNGAPADFNPQVFVQRSASPFEVELFNRQLISIVPIEIEDELGAKSAGKMVGRVEGYPLSEAVFLWQGNVGAGTINLGNGEIYRLRYIGSGQHVFEQLPPEYLPAGEPVIPPDAELAEHDTDLHKEDRTTRSRTEEKVTIDVLVLYSDDAESAMGGIEGRENTVRMAEEESNLGFENSRINVDFNVVHSEKIDFDESQYDFSQMLGVLTQTNDGVLDEIHALRDYYGADIVTMIVDRPLLCGKTYQNNGQYKDFSKFAFVVLHYSCATGYYSFAHEIGHVMGSQHNRDHAGHSGAFSYSYGYRDTAHRFRTIMAYNCEASCTRINHWSNPNVFYNGVGVTGVESDQANSAHNSLSLIQMAPSISQFREQALPLNEPTAINFQASSVDAGQDDLLDSGEAFGDRGAGLAYGWSANALISVSDGDGSAPAEATFVSAGSADGDAVQWEMLLPNGMYQVRLVSGVANEAQKGDAITVEGEAVLNEGNMQNSLESDTGIVDEELTVTVRDGRLSISSLNNQMQLTLNLIEITPLNNGGSLAGPGFVPSTTIFLPAVIR